jgi:hypothetical protein
LREQSYAVDIAGDGEDAESKASALPEAVVKEDIFLSAELVKKERPRGVSFASRLSSAVAAFIVDSSSID